MGEQTGISWTDHTHNIVWGCSKVSPACKFCYAEADAHRYGFNVWGLGAPRRVLSDDNWRKPLKWNKAAVAAGERRRVFCSSMADVFEDHPTVAEQRKRLWPLIEATPALDWLLLTKRPENVMGMVPMPWWHANVWPGNVWLGTTAEDQEWADKRIPYLLEMPAPVRFLSCEPLLGPVDLRAFLGSRDCPCRYYGTPGQYLGHSPSCSYDSCALAGGIDDCDGQLERCNCGGIHWVIVGGESGPHARPMQVAWARSLRDQCREAGVPFHFKQFGEFNAEGIRVGKEAAGRILDGRTWDEFPEVAR